MRPDRACEIAADPLNADDGDVVAALTALAVAYRAAERRRAADRAALIEPPTCVSTATTGTPGSRPTPAARYPDR